MPHEDEILETALDNLGDRDYLVPHDLVEEGYGSWLAVTDAAREYLKWREEIGMGKDGYRGLNEVRMKREDVLRIVEDNRRKHREIFEAALEGYKTKAISILNEHIVRIKTNAPERVVVNLPFPEDHSDDYERVIGMLEHSLDDELVLDSHDYAQYIMDEWGWKQQWTATAAAYTSVRE